MTIPDFSQYLDVDAGRGLLLWKTRPASFFTQGKKWSPETQARRWNNRYAGKEAFTAYDAHGYKMGRLNRVGYKAHRVIWAMHHGFWPEGDIDHINGVRDDNRIENLRAVSRADNLRNRRKLDANTSGYNGIDWFKALGKWRVRIGEIHIGVYADLEHAVVAREAAERALGYHPNHGRD